MREIAAMLGWPLGSWRELMTPKHGENLLKKQTNTKRGAITKISERKIINFSRNKRF